MTRATSVYVIGVVIPRSLAALSKRKVCRAIAAKYQASLEEVEGNILLTAQFGLTLDRAKQIYNVCKISGLSPILNIHSDNLLGCEIQKVWQSLNNDGFRCALVASGDNRGRAEPRLFAKDAAIRRGLLYSIKQSF